MAFEVQLQGWEPAIFHFGMNILGVKIAKKEDM